MASATAVDGRPKLTYFYGRGRAAVIRLALAVVVGPDRWDNVFLRTAEEMQALRDSGKLMFSQVPLLEINGKNLVQTAAIMRYLARLGNLYGSSDDDRVQVDMLADGALDLNYATFGTLPFATYGGANRAHVLKQLLLPTSRVRKYLGMFEAAAAANAAAHADGAGYLVGTTTTYCELILLHSLQFAVEVEAELRDKHGVADASLFSADAYPALHAMRNRLLAMPAIAAHLASDKRLPLGGDAYNEAVNRVLSRPPPVPKPAPAGAAGAGAGAGTGAGAGAGGAVAKEGTPTIGLNVTLHIKPERRDEFIAVVDKNAIGTNTTEAGAHLYRWGEEDGKPNTWHFQEQYSSDAALKAHQMSSHFAGWEAFAATDPFSAPPVLSKFTLRK